MAMEKQYIICEAHTRALTAVGYNPIRREILFGCEDGTVKTLEAESGKLVAVFNEHKGWVTDFVHWSDAKLMLSSANDGQVLAWGVGGGVTDRVKIGASVFCLALMPCQHQLLCGVKGGIRVYELDDEREDGHVLKSKPLYITREHKDIVRCIICVEARIFSGGYDGKLVVYDCSPENKRLHPVYNHHIHDAGITCLSRASDSDNNTWILTGSFDKTMKIWSVDGTMMHKMDNFPGSVTGVMYVPRNKIVWVAAGAPYAWLYDAKSGDNVSRYLGTFQDMDEVNYQLQSLKYFPELSMAVATTNRRQLIMWKYNTAGCVTALRCPDPLESLCYTEKNPILIFAGDHEGVISKWERNQSNPFMYRMVCQRTGNPFTLHHFDRALRRRVIPISMPQSPRMIPMRWRGPEVCANIKEDFIVGNVPKNKYVGNRMKIKREDVEKGSEPLQDYLEKKAKSFRPMRSQYAFRKPVIPPPSAYDHPHTTILRIMFIESLDYILAASENGNIYVWGFDDAAVQVLTSMLPDGVEALVEKYSILLDPNSLLLPKNAQGQGSDSVTNRVAGFVCKLVLAEHESCVSSLVTVERCPKWKQTLVLSGGWDRRVCLWNIEAGTLEDTCRTAVGTSGQVTNIVCDGIITDMAYSPKTFEFAYASSDKMVYIRKMHTNGARMFLVNTLQGHEAEVTSVEWNSVHNKWVTGSEDGTVRIWNGKGLNECEHVLHLNKAVTCMCIDQIIGSIIVAVDNHLRVYEPESFRHVQTNLGHVDSIRSVIHIPERNQYVSCSWDHTIRVWNAWKTPRVKRPQPQESRKRSSDCQIQMDYVREALKGGKNDKGSTTSTGPATADCSATLDSGLTVASVTDTKAEKQEGS